ncbi:hypothetical protein PoB_006862100 [Plakobranchus ocellatus]|uniref:Uncharacterized protein n=1 Tax=Plakobranchus ocellatus TaxID=259542 RepID=A0AAV4DD96_9GAST|nr:hypothetical protein PoB_006862100 [Plakobranchus ocellatus]
MKDFSLLFSAIDKDEFKSELQKFAKIFTDASEGLGEVENLTRTAHASGAPEDWYAVILKFISVGSEDLSKLEPALDGMGHVIERIAESPDDFPPLPYCDASLKLANGDKPEYTELEAIKAYVNIIEEAIQLGKAFDRFGDAQERLNGQQSSGGASKRSEDGNEADLKKLVRLLKELKLDTKR